VEFFEDKQKNNIVPSFTSLVDDARMLARRHATTQAFERALNLDDENPNKVPRGSDWTMLWDEVQEEHVHVGDVEMQDIDALSDLSGNADSPDSDVTLANATLFIRNAIWWCKMCKAVVVGGTGGIWEILKARYVQFHIY
jgi:hypothetical protein